MKKATGCRATWSLVLMSVMVLFATACTSPSKEFMKAQQDDTQASYRRFLDQYPSGTFSDKAKTRIAEIDRDKQERAEKKAEQEAFALAVRRGDEAALRQHLMQYPGPVFINAAHASEISARLADIEREKQKQAEQDAFELAKRKDTVEAYDAFLNTWPNSPHQQEARQRLKWQEVDPLNVDSLEAFISEFPASPHNASARALLTMQRRLAIYRNGTAVPQFTMTAKQMGRRWADSKKHVTDRDIFGYGYVETTWQPGVAGWVFRPLGKGSGYYMQGETGPALPTLNGTILAIKTKGMNTKDATNRMGEGELLFGGFHFTTPKSNGPWTDLEGTVFFGVIEGVGLVHIYGKATVISPDGTVTHLVELEDNEP